ncbi:MAG: DUF3310 domain-containing protein [Bifidobacterium mongoliense]|jgi:hypothetical protein|uniref:DUF3310 domain-containing protein n=1 Tax=Bifidobacterium mongoliense TaxID=518643 RepID=UPI002F350716
MNTDPVNHPSHYTNDRFPFECIELASRMDFCTGNTVKYVWRHLDKNNPIEDLSKARFYLNYEIQNRNPRSYWPTTYEALQKLQVLADPANHYDYQPFWQAMNNNDTDGMLTHLNQEIARLDAERMIATREDVKFTVGHQPGEVKITIYQQGKRMDIALPTETARELSSSLAFHASLAMTEAA